MSTGVCGQGRADLRETGEVGVSCVVGVGVVGVCLQVPLPIAHGAHILASKYIQFV